ncbi:MAG: hypothetical protein WKF58_14660 [Ilumatobacteraceae bacterium]
MSAIGKASPVALGRYEWGLSERTPAVRPPRRNWRDGDAIVAAALDLLLLLLLLLRVCASKLARSPILQFVADAAADLRNFPRDCWSGEGDYGRAVPSDDRQTMVALDLEGVLVPEIWIADRRAHGHRRAAPYDARRTRLRPPHGRPPRAAGTPRA